MTATWELKEDKFMTQSEVKRLRRECEDRAIADLLKGRTGGVHMWAVIDLVSTTGLRVSEVVNLNVGDLILSGESKVWVRDGKWRKEGTRESVTLNKRTTKHMREYLEYKKLVGESVEKDAPLFVSSRTRKRITVRGVQSLFKRAMIRAGLPSHYSIHALRHSYGTYLYKKKRCIRTVQKELRHRSITTTSVYADVTPEDRREAVEDVYDEPKREGPTFAQMIGAANKD